MRKRGRLMMLVSGLLVGSLAFAAPAQATENPPPPKDSHLIGSGSGSVAATLSSSEVAVTYGDGSTGFFGGTVTVTPQAATNGRACTTVSVWRYGTNSVHQELWRYTMTDQWCWDTVRHRNLSIGTPAKISGRVASFASALGWSYKGILNQRITDYYGDKWVYDAWTQGEFDLCPPRIICIEHRYPELTLYLYGDGHYDALWV